MIRSFLKGNGLSGVDKKSQTLGSYLVLTRRRNFKIEGASAIRDHCHASGARRHLDARTRDGNAIFIDHAPRDGKRRRRGLPGEYRENENRSGHPHSKVNSSENG